jgi:hypothetical protein
MTNATLNLGSDNQVADVNVESLGGRDVHKYEGVPFREVAEVLTRWLDKEPEKQSLAVAAIDAVEDRLAAVERLLERLASLLSWLAGAMLAQAIFTALALFLGLWVLLSLVGPELIAGR